MLLPLQETAIDEYLQRPELRAMGLKEIIKDDFNLFDLARTPLFLELLVELYCDSDTDIANIKARSVDELRDTLIERIIKHRYYKKHHDTAPQQSHIEFSKFLDGLCNLALHCAFNNLPEFSEDSLQPNWLSRKNKMTYQYRLLALLIWSNAIFFGLGGGVTCVAAKWLSTGWSLDALRLGTGLGLIYGLFFGFMVWLVFRYRPIVLSGKLSWSPLKFLIQVPLLALAVFFIWWPLGLSPFIGFGLCLLFIFLTVQSLRKSYVYDESNPVKTKALLGMGILLSQMSGKSRTRFFMFVYGITGMLPFLIFAKQVEILAHVPSVSLLAFGGLGGGVLGWASAYVTHGSLAFKQHSIVEDLARREDMFPTNIAAFLATLKDLGLLESTEGSGRHYRFFHPALRDYLVRIGRIDLSDTTVQNASRSPLSNAIDSDPVFHTPTVWLWLSVLALGWFLMGFAGIILIQFV